MGALVIETRIIAENAFNRDHFWMEGQTVIDFMLQLTCYSVLSLGEWAAKLQNLWRFLITEWIHIPPHSTILYMHLAMLPGAVMVKILKNDF